MVFHWSLKDCKSPQVSKMLLSIPTDINNCAFWMVYAHPLISNSFNSFTKPLWIVPSTPIIICITVTFIFHSFFSSLARSKYLFHFSFSLIFTLYKVIWFPVFLSNTNNLITIIWFQVSWFQVFQLDQLIGLVGRVFPNGFVSLFLNLFFFLLTITRSGLLPGIRWSVCISKSKIILCISFFRSDSGLCIYPRVV